jgi:16S rRNA processing protein RimM
VRVEVLTDRPEERFAPGGSLYPEGAAEPLTIETASAVADGPGWWLTFREVQGRAAAEGLRDAYLEVAVDRAADLPPGQAYWHEVIGSEVRGSTGRTLGTVADVYRAGESEVYVVRGPAGEFDVPAVRGIVTTFAPERSEIVVDEGALDLEAPPVDAPPAVERPPRKRPRWSRHGKGAAKATPPERPGETSQAPEDAGGA